MQIKEIVILYLVSLNIIGIVMTWLDKLWAIKGQWRIAEKWFFRLSIIGSGIGIFLACLLFYHKIRNKKFMLGIPLIVIIQVILIIIVAKNYY